ncbi:hypothetical protein GOODEAATRI_025806 [Goodea atripinnis]|uniref:Uncharacterized protein n=1 Tax=Goodea atripinnis TaxID=208336 RepID=A0ABV0MWL7_9TELE
MHYFVSVYQIKSHKKTKLYIVLCHTNIKSSMSCVQDSQLTLKVKLRFLSKVLEMFLKKKKLSKLSKNLFYISSEICQPESSMTANISYRNFNCRIPFLPATVSS